MGGFIELIRKEGHDVYPVTVAEAVKVGGMNLRNYLDKMIPGAAYADTVEDGLYICDANGNYIAKFLDDVDILLSSSLVSQITSIAESVRVTIDQAEPSSVVSRLRHLTDGGWMTSNICSTVVYIGDKDKGNHDIDIAVADYLVTDICDVRANVPIAIQNIERVDMHTLRVSVQLISDAVDVVLNVRYSVLSPDSYDKVRVKLRTSSADAVPYFPSVKFNKKFPFVWTSDDMGLGEYTGSWCFFNGYATGRAVETYPCGVDVLNGVNMGAYFPIHRPLTFSDGAGKQRRYTCTHAIWPQSAGDNNYTLMDGADAAIMARTGDSFAFHDVDQSGSVEIIASRFPILSDIWNNYTGYGLKVMVEPNGNKNYERAVQVSDAVCLSVMQNTTAESPDVGVLSPLISDWASGRDVMSYRRKNLKALIRDFIQGKEQNLYNALTNGDGTRIVITGSHGMGSDVMQWIHANLAKRDDVWVCSADELWEYYHLHNHACIDALQYDSASGILSFDVVMPRYSKHQYRELTVNVPVSDGFDCQVSGAVTCSFGQESDYFTLNIGLESRIYEDIMAIINLLRENPDNACLRRDAQYLISLLSDGDMKTFYQNQLDTTGNKRYILSVRVSDGSGMAVDSAVASIRYPQGDTYSAYVHANGELCIANIPEGTAELTVSATGYNSYETSLDISSCIDLDIKLT